MRIDPMAIYEAEKVAKQRAIDDHVAEFPYRKIETDLSKTAYGHLNHIQMAGLIRSLMRNDLTHESIVCAARDRIEWLAVELRAAQYLLAELGLISDAIDPKIGEMLKTLAPMEVTETRVQEDKKWKNTYIDGTVNNKHYQLVVKERLND